MSHFKLKLHMDKFHVSPIDDLIEHYTDGDGCHCEPRTKYLTDDEGDGYLIVLHNSYDFREVRSTILNEQIEFIS